MSRYVLQFFSVCFFFTNSELKHVNEILSKRWNISYITNIDNFLALFYSVTTVSD